MIADCLKKAFVTSVGKSLLIFISLGVSASSWSYVTLGFSWANSSAEVYLNFDISNPPAYRPINAVSGLTNADFQQAYVDAMQEWNSTTNFQWFANESGAEPQPCKGVLNGASFDDTLCNEVSFGSSVLAVQTNLVSGSTARRTFTTFNNNKLWNIYSGTGTGTDFRRVAVHELGHGLGLNHAGSNAIMYQFVSSIEVPQTDDINGVNNVYPASGGNDIDGDGVANASDNCPLVSNGSQTDADGDGTGNACDLNTDLADYDEDGVLNGTDNCPLDANDGQVDSDGDGIGDLCDLDRDDDGLNNLDDNCPEIANAGQEDLDSDGLGNVCDDDSDGDGVLSYQTVDVSHEYVDVTEPDTQLVGQAIGAGPTSSSNSSFYRFGQAFTAGTTGQLTAFDLPFFCADGDITVQLRNVISGGSNAGSPGSTVYSTETFTANGGILPKNSQSGFTRFEFSSPHTVSSGAQYAIYVSVTGACVMFGADDPYAGGDGRLGSSGWVAITGVIPSGDYRFRVWVLPSVLDNCPLVANVGQADSNSNGVGDACDPMTLDGDSDGVVDALDNCPGDANADQLNTDGDSEGDACDSDDDNDTVDDGVDNCPLVANPAQTDTDGDLDGDACDTDDDNDGLSDQDEINIYGTDPLNEDTDNDGDNDGVEVANGTDPLNPPEINIPVPLPAIWLLLATLILIVSRIGLKVTQRLD